MGKEREIETTKLCPECAVFFTGLQTDDVKTRASWRGSIAKFEEKLLKFQQLAATQCSPEEEKHRIGEIIGVPYEELEIGLPPKAQDWCKRYSLFLEDYKSRLGEDGYVTFGYFCKNCGYSIVG